MQQIAELGAWEWDIQTNTVTWSDELYSIYGVTRDDYEPSYAAYLGRVHPDDRAHVEAAINGAVEDHEPFEYDERILRAGRKRALALESRGQVYLDADGQPVLMRGVCRDITERQRMKDALQEAKERARRVVEDAHEAFVAIDDCGRITDWNPQAEVTFGWSRAEAVGRPLAETIIPERYWPAHFNGLNRFLTSGESPRAGPAGRAERSASRWPRVPGGDLDLRGQDGGRLHLQCPAARHHRAQAHRADDPGGGGAVSRGVRRRADRDGAHRHWRPLSAVNGALCEITGHRARASTGHQLFDSLTHPDDWSSSDRHATRTARRATRSSSTRSETRCVHASAARRSGSLSHATVMRDGSGDARRFCSVQVLDVTASSALRGEPAVPRRPRRADRAVQPPPLRARARPHGRARPLRWRSAC